jgi:hypothetical protein
MKIFLAVLILLSAPAFATTTTLTGTITDAQGNPLNGVLTMQLPVPAQDTTLNVAVSNAPVSFNLVNGAITPVGNVALKDVATLQPQGLYYIARGYDTAGNLQFFGNYVVTGASFNLGAATPTSVTTSNISYLLPVFPNSPNTFTALQTFNNGINVTSGTSTFAGSFFTLNLNNTQMCDQFAGASADIKVNACIAALPTTGGIADARGLIGTQTVAGEIDVGGPAGNPTKFVNLLLPCGAVWNVTINNGTSSAIKVFGASSVVAFCSQQQSFELKLAAAGNVASLVTNDQTCASCSFRLYGFMLYNTLLGTVANAMMDLSNLGNNAEVTGINIATFTGKGLWIHGGNSESTFSAVNVDGSQKTGAAPCTIETTSSSLETMRFYALDCQHPGPGQSLLVINGHGAANLSGLTFVGSHFEGSSTDTTTPFISLTDAKNIAFYSPFWNSLDAGSTNYGLTISQTVLNLTDGITVVNATHGNGNFINDTIRSKIITGTGILPYYSYTAANSNVGQVFSNGAVMTELAAPSNSNPGGTDICYADSTAHTQKCKYNGGNYHVIPLMESGTCSMSAGTTCTFSIGNSFSTSPTCQVSIDQASSPPGAGISAKCSASGTTVTVTAGTSNSLTWDGLVIGNPN